VKRAARWRAALASKFETLTTLHVPGDPDILYNIWLYNIWDVGSAYAVVAAGAKALATGVHPVADANGCPMASKCARFRLRQCEADWRLRCH
jgi:2-methylisocitrate lyase-like PEP mutase family enzyme